MVSPVLQIDIGEYRGRFREDGRWLGEGFEPASSQPAPPPGSVTRVTRVSTMSARLRMRGGVPLAAITFGGEMLAFTRPLAALTAQSSASATDTAADHERTEPATRTRRRRGRRSPAGIG